MSRETELNGASRQAMIAGDENLRKVMPRFFMMEISGGDFYAFLNAHAERELGPPEKGFQRTITFQSVPEKNVVELTIVDAPPQPQPEVHGDQS